MQGRDVPARSSITTARTGKSFGPTSLLRRNWPAGAGA